MAEDTEDHAVNRLQRIWAAEPPPARIRVEELRAEAVRRRRRMLWVVAGEVVLTAGVVAWTVTILLAEGPTSSATMTGLAGLWLTWAIVAGFATWNRRGVWTPAAETARSYLALAEERARRRRRVATFVIGLTAVQTLVLVAVEEATGPGLFLIALYAGWAVWYGRRARRDLDEIRRIAAEFREEEGPV